MRAGERFGQADNEKARRGAISQIRFEFPGLNEGRPAANDEGVEVSDEFTGDAGGGHCWIL